MAYIGKQPVRGQNRELDDISGSFNGSNTAFTMQVGGVNTSPGSVNQLFISVGGVMQNPGTDFTAAASTLTFTTAPPDGASFWGLIQGDSVNINTPSDGSVTSTKLANDSVTGSKLSVSLVAGDTLYASGTDTLARLPKGTDGQVLKLASGLPSWAADTAGMPTTGGTFTGDVTFDGTGGDTYWDESDKKWRYTDDVKCTWGTGYDLEIYHSSSVNHIRSQNGNLVLGTENNHMVILGAYYAAAGGGDTVEVWGGSNLLPATNDAIDLGETNHKWDDIYATNGTIITSDRNNKDNITDSDLGLTFINKLSPKSYKFKGKTRIHYGLVAQDVETVLNDISKPTSGFAGFIKTDAPVQLYTERDEAHNRIPSGKSIGDEKVAAHTDYGLRYDEFIGPLIKAVQELSAEVETLKTKVAALEAA